MKIGIFTDAHYSSRLLTGGGRQNSRSLEKIKQAYAFFEKEGCDLVICLGDLTDADDTHEKEVENLRRIAAVIHGSPLATVCVRGNHDAFTFTEEEFYTLLGGCRPEPIEAEGKTLLFTDACCFKSGRRYLPGDTDWTDCFCPDTEELQAQLAAAAGDVYLFLHQNLDPDIRGDHRPGNADAVNAMLRENGRVKAVFQGHYHLGNKSEHDGIRYVTFFAMCENENAFFTEEL